MGQFQPSDALRDGSGERALFVAEELALQQARGDGGAVEVDEGTLAARTDRVKRPRISSLPVPVSPRIRTVASVGATVSTCFKTRLSGPRLSPYNSLQSRTRS